MDNMTYATAKDLKTTINYLTNLKGELEGPAQAVVNITNRTMPAGAPAMLTEALGAMELNLVGQAIVLVENLLVQFQNEFDNL